MKPQKSSKLLGFLDYVVMLVWGSGLFIVSGVGYSLYFQGGPWDVFEKIYIFWYSSRASWFTHGMFLDLEKFGANLVKMFRSMFVKMPFLETDGYLTTLTTPEFPMFLPFVWLLVLIGWWLRT